MRVLGVEVALTKTSYVPGEPTDLRIASDSPSLELQVFHYAGPERFVERDLRTVDVGDLRHDHLGLDHRQCLARLQQPGKPLGIADLAANQVDREQIGGGEGRGDDVHRRAVPHQQ